MADSAGSAARRETTILYILTIYLFLNNIFRKNFRPAYAQLSMLSALFPKVPIVALTATATERTRRAISSSLGMTDPQGCHGQGKVREKQKFFKVREKSGNFAKSQGKSQFLSKSVKSQGILFSGWRKVL